MESATSTRHSGLSLASCRFSSRLCPFLPSTNDVTALPSASFDPSLRRKKSHLVRSSSVRSKSSASFLITSTSMSARAAFSPSASMSKAPLDARPKSLSTSCAGHVCVLGQRMSLSDSFSGRSFVPHDGQSSGISNSVSLPSRSDSTGPTTSGMTSPAFRNTTVSPMSSPFRTTSKALCSVALSTVEPATRTGSITAKGVTRPVRPTCTSMSRSFVFTSSGGNLYATAHLGTRLV